MKQAHAGETRLGDLRSADRVIGAGGLAAAAGGYYYYYADQTDPHAQLKGEEERLRQRAEEFRDAGRATARDAVRDSEAKYEETKVRRAPRTIRPSSSALTVFIT